MVNSSLANRIMAMLADGRFHSGAQLAQQLQVSRTAIWKIIKQLCERGLSIHRVHGKGYQLSRYYDLLDAEIIKTGLSTPCQERIGQITILQQVDSTNNYLLQHGRHGDLCLAEEQTMGRGRRGKQWIAAYACNLNYSLRWQFNHGASSLAGLSLVVGMAVVAALQKMQCNGIQLKWPNDLIYQQQKLAGVLLDISGDAVGPCQIIIGIGLNVRQADNKAKLPIDQPWIDLESIAGKSVSRNALASAISNQLIHYLLTFEREGLNVFKKTWQAMDALFQQPVAIEQAGQSLVGIAQGIDQQGGLLVTIGDELRTFHSGEVSIRQRRL